MYKKIAVVIITTLFLSLIFSPATMSFDVNKAETSTGFGFKDIFSAYPIIRIEYDDEAIAEEVIPNNGSISIPLYVYYQIYGLFSNWHAKKLKNTYAQIELSIVEKPEWCTATIIPSVFTSDIGTSFGDPVSTTLIISVNEKAPAFTQGKVTIQATSPEIKGLIFTKVREGKVKFDVPFLVGYSPIISYAIEGNLYEIPPNNVTEIPIKLENLGNGKTHVGIEIVDVPAKWNISFPKTVVLGSSLLGENNEEELVILVRPSKDFSRETMRVKFTPSYLDNPDLKGTTHVLSLIFENDGSYKENEGLLGVNLFIILIIVIISILIIVSILLLKRKKQ